MAYSINRINNAEGNMSLPINQIICGDCNDVTKEFPDESVDLIFTDPPYTKDCIYLYRYLADIGSRLLKPSRFLVTIVGHYAIDDILEYFKDSDLDYRWIFCLNQFNGPHARLRVGIEVMWKPMLVFVKKTWRHGLGYLRDGVEITGKGGIKKEHHKWEQDLSFAEYYINKLSAENEIVLDPFCGSGTFCLAAKKLNRNFIGIDISEDYCKIAIDRINNV